MKNEIVEIIKTSQLYIRGIADTPNRKEMIEKAIASIQKGEHPWKKTYWGFKNYAHFGDQEIECEYGMGPTYGSVVFEIGCNDWGRDKDKLGHAEILCLLSALGFEGFKSEFYGNKYSFTNLARHISELDKSWEIIKKALFDGLLGPAAKCSTAKENPRQQDMQSAVIVCYTKDWSDEKDLERVSNSIRKLGFNQRLFYKKDSATLNKIYGAKSWYVDRAANT